MFRNLIVLSMLVFSTVFAGVNLSFGEIDMEGGNVEVLMSNDEAVGGFQFGLSGAQITGASGGIAQANGFTVSTSSSLVLGFSLTGATLPPGEGVLINVSFNATGDEVCFTDAVISSAAGSGIPTNLGDCTGGSGGGGDEGVSLTLDNLTDGSVDVYMTSDQAVGGFQFSLEGVTITGASGGSAQANGFMLSTSGSLVLGFSLQDQP